MTDLEELIAQGSISRLCDDDRHLMFNCSLRSVAAGHIMRFANLVLEYDPYNELTHRVIKSRYGNWLWVLLDVVRPAPWGMCDDNIVRVTVTEEFLHVLPVAIKYFPQWDGTTY